MLEHGFRHLPVLDDEGQVIGVVSLRRVVGATQAAARTGLTPGERPASTRLRPLPLAHERDELLGGARLRPAGGPHERDLALGVHPLETGLGEGSRARSDSTADREMKVTP